jgi:hypothetical protein
MRYPLFNPFENVVIHILKCEISLGENIMATKIHRPTLRLFTIILVITFLLSACKTSPTGEIANTESIKSTASPEEADANATATAEPTLLSSTPTHETVNLSSWQLPAFTVNVGQPFSEVQFVSQQSTAFTGVDYMLPLNLNQVVNPQVISGLTEEQRNHLRENGFVVMHTQEEQFYIIREVVSKINGQPYYLTTDAAFHALHLTFDDLLKALEKEQLRTQMIDILRVTLEEVLTYLPAMQDTAIEEDSELATAYLSVALKLLEPGESIDPRFADIVDQQVQQIYLGEGKSYSVLIPDFEDDYGAYKPVGHYTEDEELEQYFRAMTWLGRVHFTLADTSSSRAPLIITLALRRANIEGRSAADLWGTIHEVLTFLVGPTDDAGPVEYSVLMDEVYGDSPNPLDLADDSMWENFVLLRDEVPAPQINSTFVDWLDELKQETGWRFMGQRFTLDGYIFQNLVFDKVKPLNDERRLLPKGPDIMAVLGSEAAMETLVELGETDYPGYLSQMQTLQERVQEQSEEQWLACSYDAWLYVFLPILQPKEEAYPTYMQTTAWGYKDLNTALGSWAELKHDTILYTKMPEAAGGGGPPCTSGPAPGYVEPNTEAFFRMSYVADTIAEGLRQRNLVASYNTDWADPTTLDGLAWWMNNLGEQFHDLGEITIKERNGTSLDERDYAIIQRCLGVHECSSKMGNMLISSNDDNIPPPPIVAAVAGAGQADAVLEVGTGFIDRIYVVVPIGGRMQVAQGGVFSYYEFVQPRAERLTDQEWRERLQSTEVPELPPWASNFVLHGGSPTEVMGFHIGAAYTVTEEGDGLNLRQSPGRDKPVVAQINTNEFIRIIEGPTIIKRETWWKFTICGTETTGWVLEDPTWYSRYWQ